MVNYTNKTQFLFRIEKGVPDVNDMGVNDYFPPQERRVPFRNIAYIGDSATDIPCMKLVNANNGHSIGVYDPTTCDKQKVFQMITDQRIRYFAPADYSEGAQLDTLLKAIIEKTAAYEVLERQHEQAQTETDEYMKVTHALTTLAAQENIQCLAKNGMGGAPDGAEATTAAFLQKWQSALEALLARSNACPQDAGDDPGESRKV